MSEFKLAPIPVIPHMSGIKGKGKWQVAIEAAIAVRGISAIEFPGFDKRMVNATGSVISKRAKQLGLPSRSVHFRHVNGSAFLWVDKDTTGRSAEEKT